jgi:hypothetical protein
VLSVWLAPCGLRSPGLVAGIALFLNFDQNLKSAAVMNFVLILLPPSSGIYS